jgi:hypothetical protein
LRYSKIQNCLLIRAIDLQFTQLGRVASGIQLGLKFQSAIYAVGKGGKRDSTGTQVSICNLRSWEGWQAEFNWDSSFNLIPRRPRPSFNKLTSKETQPC